MIEKELASLTKKKTSSKIIKVTKTLFGKQGIETTTISQIALECDITRRTVYDHFTNKDEIVHTILKEYFAELYIIDFTKITSDNKVERLKQLLHLILDRYLDNPKIMRFIINYYQLNPQKVLIEDEIIAQIDGLSELERFLTPYKNEVQTPLESVEIVFHYILGIGMRFALRSNSYLGFFSDISKEGLHNSLDKLMLIFEE